MNISFSVIEEGAQIPSIAHEGDAGIDLYAVEITPLYRGEPQMVSTGVHLNIPSDYFGMVVPRSSMGACGIIIPNAPGIIDPGYPGVLKVLLLNLCHDRYIIKKHDRIAQLIILPREEYKLFLNGREFQSQQRIRTGGFGSSGK